jgi:CRISPR/Cas system-associated protein Csm6
MLILDNARVNYEVKNAATKILNYDTGTKAHQVVKEAVKDVLEETIKNVTEKIEKNETVGEYSGLVDSLLNTARGNLINE